MRKIIVTMSLIVDGDATPDRVRDYLRTVLIMPWDTNPIKMITDMAASDADPRAAAENTPTIRQ
jgi:hypothetical protein